MIHSTAIIDPKAKLGKNVFVGAYSVIGADVVIDDECNIGPHVVIKGPTKIGKETKIYQFASIGDDPQDKKYAGEKTQLIIGERNVIRECCTINRGTIQDQSTTKIGNDNWIMAYVHIAHDCVIGNNTIFANNTSLAGHVTVGDNAILGGFTIVHQFCQIGANCFTGLSTTVNKDIPPFVMASGNLAKAHGLNTEGLKRKGYSNERIKAIKDAYKIIYRSGNTLEQAKEKLELLHTESEDVKMMLDFLKNVTRGIIR